MFRASRLIQQAAQIQRTAPHPALKLTPAVRSALQGKAPVVALESTIITHGLPYPYNQEVARELEDTVREQGAVPATTALLDGQALVGVSDAQLDRLAKCAQDPAKNTAIKASRRDIAQVLAKGQGSVGGTTVSGTMVLAHMAGIPIFATGGIGGVHRGAESTMDISADLTELGRTPVAVFCSGPKSILDIPRTLEVLETYGVSVTTFNPSGEFPAFYTSASGLFAPYAGSNAEAAASIYANLQMGMQSGQVFGNPIPSEWENVGQQIQQQVEIAVKESIDQGIFKRGKEVTPWLLKRLAQLIPESKESNRALVVNNAKRAAQVAVELHRISKDAQTARDTHSLGSLEANKPNNPQVLVFGAAAVDVTSQTLDADIDSKAATTHRGSVSVTLGGVARNVAETASKALCANPSAVKLVSPHGDDDFGTLLRQKMQQLGMRVDGLFLPSNGKDMARTAVCSLVLNSQGDLISGVADMDISHQHFLPNTYSSMSSLLQQDSPRIVAFDGNIGERQATQILEACQTHNLKQPSRPVRTLFEPTSYSKATIVLQHFLEKGRVPVTYATPNVHELLHIFDHAHRLNLLQKPTLGPSYKGAVTTVLPADVLTKANTLIQSGIFEVLLVKAGKSGVVSISRDQARHQPIPAGQVKVVNTTGCGDSFAGGFIAALCSISDVQGHDLAALDKAVLAGQLAARNTLQSNMAVGPGMGSLLTAAGLCNTRQ